ncbi:MAG TPA: hypothetical protein VGI16_03320 [Candidatus Acidoferrum sp.]|jgi:hypothetical protein
MENKTRAPLRLALIGMSGTGKTFWTKKLTESGLPGKSCDDHIEECLRPRLSAGGYEGINGVAAWMGWPDSPTYLEREAAYLAEEISALDGFLTELERNPSQELILDTTGSVIHTGNNLLMRLRRQMTVVHLAASAGEQQLLVERYLGDPKPVLWRGIFQPRPRETARETVARCYPALIAARRQSYEVLAHCTLPVAELRESAGNPPMSAAEFLQKISAQIDRRG